VRGAGGAAYVRGVAMRMTLGGDPIADGSGYVKIEPTPGARKRVVGDPV
jgi:hypothetical protein